LFAPLRNGCYYQIAGEPVVELKVIEKGNQEKMSKGGRKTHCRTKKRRGKKGKGMKELEEKGAVDKEEVREVVEMEVDRESPTQTVEVLDQPILEPIKRTRFLGPSKSAPSLLPSTSFTPSVSHAETQSQRLAQTQASPTKRSGSSMVNASTAVALKGTQVGLEALKQKKFEQKQIAKKLKRLPTLSALFSHSPHLIQTDLGVPF